MKEILSRIFDVALVVSSAFVALFISIPASGFDGSLVAFAAALALSVFPACGIYKAAVTRPLISIFGRVALAWCIVQVCCIALLYLLHRSELLSNPWFACWALVSGIGLALFRVIALAASAPIRRSLHANAAESLVGSRLSACSKGKQHLKRMFDIVTSLLLLMALSPVLLGLAFAVGRDGGPVVFGHPRIGRNGREFKCLKFRSMVVDADAVLKQLLASNPQARAEWDREFKLKSDVRITRIGHFLRRTSLDELPQLINVLRGDMSLVGPRPIVQKKLARYGEYQAWYLAARPGMTGLWQVSGRNNTDYATRVALDVSYVKEWSLRRDFVILFKTFSVVFRGDGAY